MSLISIDEMKSTIINKLIDLAEWLKWWPIACVYARLEQYKKPYSTLCPFCPRENSNHIAFLLTEDKHRSAILNKFPYPRTEKHYLLVPKRHIVEYSELQWCELDELADILQRFLWMWYLMLWRQYPMAWSSVEHLHIHLIKW